MNDELASEQCGVCGKCIGQEECCAIAYGEEVLAYVHKDCADGAVS